jgi:deoxyribonuclease-4
MIGSNVSTVGGISKGFIQAGEWEAECIQIYTTPSRSWKVPDRTDEEIDAFKDAQDACGQVKVIAHVPFLVNLASPDSTTQRRSTERLITELLSAEQLGIDRIILHPGNSIGRDPKTALMRIAQGVTEAFLQTPKCKTMILLETMAGQGSQLGSRFEELAFIFEHVDASKRLGICWDTCHLYAAGYNLRGRDGFIRVMHEFDKILGVTLIKAFHLNDSKCPLFSKIDRHCSIGSGLLGFQVFHAIVTDQRFGSIPMIVENPDRDRKSLQDILLLKDLRSKLTVPVDPSLPNWASSWQMPLLDATFT